MRLLLKCDRAENSSRAKNIRGHTRTTGSTSSSSPGAPSHPNPAVRQELQQDCHKLLTRQLAYHTSKLQVKYGRQHFGRTETGFFDPSPCPRPSAI
jgi:hypothetical protein